MLKMVMITYNEAIYAEVMEVLENCGLKNYTKITAVYGRGSTSGTHLGTDIWPGRNNLLYVVCEEKQTKQVLSLIKESRKKLGQEGLKAFLFALEDFT